MPVVPADPTYRRNVVACLVIMALIGAAALVWARPAFVAWLEAQHPRDAVRAMQILFAAAFVPAIPFGLAMLRAGRRIGAAGQYPPPGMKVVVDTAIVTGDAARRQARGFLVVGAALCLVGVIGMLGTPALVVRMLTPR